jgi:CubicO group peptidase (beta-lactamase class C family)
MSRAPVSRRGVLQGAVGAAGLASAAVAQAAPAAGWSAEAVGRLATSAQALQLVSLIVLHQGRPVLSWGDTGRPCTIHSMRKALISALYGRAAAKAVIDLGKTLGELGIEDDVTLTESEKSATVEDLLKARSGVYLPLAPGIKVPKERPARGAYAPGTHWVYNNWDFNVLGAIYERLTHKDVFVAFAHEIAAPLGMEDFDPYRDGNYYYDDDALGGNRRYPNYRTALSARDQARFGQLYLQNGEWQGRQILPRDWIARSTRPWSQTGMGGISAGYGYLWWTGAPEGMANPPRVMSAAGAYGHYVGVIPDLDVVIVVQPDTMGPTPHPVSREQYEALIRDIAAAHPGRA